MPAPLPGAVQTFLTAVEAPRADPMKPIRLLLLLLAGAMILPACKDMGTAPPASTPAPPPLPSGTPVSYRTDILPILENSGCVGCHGGTNGLTVSSVAGLLHGGLHGPAVVPGNADSSNIVRKISPNPPFGDRMPQGGPYLSTATIQLIRTWIDQGAKDN